jgi:hypothetical protein
VTIAHELRRQTATLIFDPEDRYARERGVRGSHPRPIGPIKFCLVGRMVGGSRQDFDRPLKLVVGRNASGYYLFFGAIRLADGTSRRDVLADGMYVVRVESRFYQWAEREDIALPMPDPEAPYFFDLEPGYAYPFPMESTRPGGRGPTLLRGSLHRPDGHGIARATIQVVGQSNTYRTDDTGQWVLVFPDTQPSGDVTVHFDFPDGKVENVANVPVVQGRESSLPQTALRGWVLTEAGVGIRDAIVRVSGYPGRTTTRRDGSWFYYFGLNQMVDTVSVTAVLPDGRSLTQSNVQVQPRATVVVPTFRF